MMGDDPPYLSVGTEVSAKYKGAFCEAKIRKVVKSVKCKILFKQGLGMSSVGDDAVKGSMRVGAVVEARHPDKKEFIEGTITKIQDCSQYTVVFDDGDITTLRRTALCLKSGRHFAESETLDQLPLTHPEHFGNPVVGGRRGRRRGAEDESGDEEEAGVKSRVREEKEADIGRVVCVEGDKKKQRDNWFPGLVVAPTAQDTVRIHVREEYLVRSFKDGRYYTVPKKETTEFTREAGAKVDNHSVKAAVEKALLFLDKDELPPHWDRELLFGLNEPSNYESDHDSDSDNPDDEPREEKDHFVAQLYKFMDDRGTPINQGPTICSRDVDLYRLFYVVHNLGGYNRVSNHNHWKTVSRKLGYGQSPVNVNLVKQLYKRFLHSFEEFYRKLGCTMVNHPRTYRNRGRAGRSLIRDKDRQGGSKSESKERSDVDEAEEEPVKEEVEIKEEPVEPVITKIKPEPKEEPVLKKPVDKDKETIKIKEEKKEEDIKIEPTKEKTRMRTKLKSVEGVPVKKEIKKEEEPKEDEKKTDEKKRRFFTRGPKKEKLGLLKSGPGLALTRQKRAIKDKVKAIVDKFRIRLTKDSSSTTSDSSDKSININKEKPLKVKEEIVPPPPVVKKKEEIVKEVVPVVSEDKKKVGRKKKEKKDQDEVFDSLPTYKTVCVGDKLKVYYGPTNESKVTYEAKVLSVKTEGSEVMYLVHYTGWNNRYDEYIKHSRIADNLSWVPGRASKKPSLSFLKPGRRKNSISKIETSVKNDGPNSHKIDGKSELSLNKIDCLNTNIKNSGAQPNSQNKGGKPAITRSSSRNNKRDEVTSDNEMEEETECSMPSLYMSDELLSEKTQSEKVKEILGINDESSLVSVADRRKTKRRCAEESPKQTETRSEQKDSSEINTEDMSQSPKLDRRKKRSQSESENHETVEKKTRQISRRRRSSSTAEDKSDTTISAEADSGGSSDERRITRKRSSGLDSPDSLSSQKKKRFLDKKFDTKPFETDTVQNLNMQDESAEKNCNQETEEALKGRDFDLIQIRSELKGLDKAVKTESDSFKSLTSDIKTANEKKAEAEKLAEDIYEFKEPEPFEFEVRKCSEEKGKSLQRRPLGRMFDDTKKQSSVLLPNMFYKGKKETSVEEQKKTFLNTIYNFEEESYDKVSSSPRRLEGEENKPFQLFTDLPEEESKKSPESINASYGISKNEIFKPSYCKSEEPSSPASVASSKSNSPINAELNENSNFDSNEVESTSKSCFSRDEDEDELEDESINFAIQRAIKQEISDDEDGTNTQAPNLISVESSLFSTNDRLQDKPVIVETIEEKNNLENSLVLDKTDKSECESKSDDQVSNSSGSDEENDFIIGSVKGEEDDEEEDDEEEDEDGDGDDDDEEEEGDDVEIEEKEEGEEKIDNETVTAIMSSPVIVSTTIMEDNVEISEGEIVSDGSIITPIIMSSDGKVDTLEFPAEQEGETIYPMSMSPLSGRCLEEERIDEAISASIQVDTTSINSDHSNRKLDSIDQIMQEDNVRKTMETESEFTFKPITVPPPEESESTISLPYTDNKSNDEIIINLEPLRQEDEEEEEDDDDKLNDEEEAKVDLNLASLLCEETIPGSPSSHMECSEQVEEEKVEPTPANIVESKMDNIEEIISQPLEEEIVKIDEVGETETGENTDSSKSARECEDTENYNKESDEERHLDKTPTKQESSSCKKHTGTKRPRSVKKRHSEPTKRRYNRGRGTDSDDTSENSNIGGIYGQTHTASCEREIGEPTLADQGSKYNFLVSFDPSMDQASRIALIQNSIQQIRKVYGDLKSELAVVDRRRKKLRKRERENLAAVRLH